MTPAIRTDKTHPREDPMPVKIDRVQPAGMNVRMQQGKPA